MDFLYPDRKHHKLPSMTVAEMIQTLQGYDPDMLADAARQNVELSLSPEKL